TVPIAPSPQSVRSASGSPACNISASQPRHLSPREIEYCVSALEDRLERALFASRWLLAPLYVGLVVGLVIVALKFFVALWKLVSHFSIDAPVDDVTVDILSLIDIALLGNLIIIVIFA